jgi:hypothetical protein
MERLGTIDRMDSVMAALLAEIAEGGMATPSWAPFRTPTLGVPGLTVRRLLKHLVEDLKEPRRDPAGGEMGRVLDTAIEAQVHGPIELQQDVELLVADPAFAETHTAMVLREVAQQYGIPLRWHAGFQLQAQAVPGDFRGPAVARLARRIAREDGILDAAVIGTAEASLRQEPASWREWGSEADVLQLLKQLWHVMVHYGAPATGPQ